MLCCRPSPGFKKKIKLKNSCNSETGGRGENGTLLIGLGEDKGRRGRLDILWSRDSFCPCEKLGKILYTQRHTSVPQPSQELIVVVARGEQGDGGHHPLSTLCFACPGEGSILSGAGSHSASSRLDIPWSFADQSHQFALDLSESSVWMRPAFLPTAHPEAPTLSWTWARC